MDGGGGGRRGARKRGEIGNDIRIGVGFCYNERGGGGGRGGVDLYGARLVSLSRAVYQRSARSGAVLWMRGISCARLTANSV